ncbi:5-formyltetrahydrofolate cyclo-ligase [Candidatus Desantisbacteria bacterium]|nr:5-formyltetrahydrofolate cyclo-ligase [Candidatus Desantisbacteria bacterium]
MKKSLRTSILSIRNALSHEERCQKSMLIAEKLFCLEKFHESSSILFYVATRSEVQTEGMIKQAIQQGKRVFVPVTDIGNKRLLVSELHDFDIELAKGAYGILEPMEIYQRFVPLSEVETIIVPGVAFDLQGYRIGYGGGYYDRMIEQIEGTKVAQAFLPVTKGTVEPSPHPSPMRRGSNVCLIGVCFECQLIDAVPVESHDMAVGIIITEKRMIVTNV